MRAAAPTPNRSPPLSPVDTVALLEPCVGEFVGTYSGDVTGGVSAELGENGAIPVALAGEREDPLLRITATVEGDPPVSLPKGAAER